MRYFCTVAYNGLNYHGWQMQKNAVSVQEIVAEGFSKVFRQAVDVTASGRTDTGVHASCQVVHFDVDRLIGQEYLGKLNSILPKDISVRALSRVNDKAHARFDATKRSYEYRILRCKDPFLTDLAYLYTLELNLESMNMACNLLKSHDDFQCFSRVKTDVNNFLCDISEAFWTAENDLFVFHVSSNRFLRGMVRAIVGTLLDVGSGKTSLDDFKGILQSGNRTQAGRSVPAQGLHLCNVIYPKEIYID